MKKNIFLLIAFLLINVVSIAQDSVRIKGVPIKNSYNKFVKELKNKGFEYISEDEKQTILYGLFLDEESLIIVQNSDGNISNVLVILQRKYNKWSSIKHHCDDIIEIFIKRFGKPYSVIHEYEFPFREGDGYETTALMDDKLKYTTYFRVDGCTILIYPTKTFQIVIGFTNDEVYMRKQDERINDI